MDPAEGGEGGAERTKSISAIQLDRPHGSSFGPDAASVSSLVDKAAAGDDDNGVVKKYVALGQGRSSQRQLCFFWQTIWNFVFKIKYKTSRYENGT